MNLHGSNNILISIFGQWHWELWFQPALDVLWMVSSAVWLFMMLTWWHHCEVAAYPIRIGYLLRFSSDFGMKFNLLPEPTYYIAIKPIYHIWLVFQTVFLIRSHPNGFSWLVWTEMVMLPTNAMTCAPSASCDNLRLAIRSDPEP